MIRPNRILLLLLMLATTCVDTFIFLVVDSSQYQFHLAMLGVLFGQTGVLSVWLAVGRGSFAGRFGATFAGNIGIVFLLATYLPVPPLEVAVLGGFVLCMSVMTFVFAVLARWAIRLWNSRKKPDGAPAESRTFSLWKALSAFTFFSITLAVARHTDLPWNALAEVLQLFAAFALASLTAAICVFSSKHFAMRLVGFLALSSALAVWVSKLPDFAPDIEWLLLGSAGYSAIAFAALKAYDRTLLFGGAANRSASQSDASRI